MTLQQLRACALHFQGFTHAQIAERFGVKKEAIKARRRRARERLRRNGLTLPTRRPLGTRHVRTVDVNEMDRAA